MTKKQSQLNKEYRGFYLLVDKLMSIEKLETATGLSYEEQIVVINDLKTRIDCTRAEIKKIENS